MKFHRSDLVFSWLYSVRWSWSFDLIPCADDLVVMLAVFQMNVSGSCPIFFQAPRCIPDTEKPYSQTLSTHVNLFSASRHSLLFIYFLYFIFYVFIYIKF